SLPANSRPLRSPPSWHHDDLSRMLEMRQTALVRPAKARHSAQCVGKTAAKDQRRRCRNRCFSELWRNRGGKVFAEADESDGWLGTAYCCIAVSIAAIGLVGFGMGHRGGRARHRRNSLANTQDGVHARLWRTAMSRADNLPTRSQDCPRMSRKQS